MAGDRVAVMLSGGVDSAVAAHQLVKAGYQVEGVFMKNWTPLREQSLADCPWQQDQADAAAVCKQLVIPFQSINFEVEYKRRVVDYLLREYEAGRTPNPDILCNREIKFGLFFDWAMAAGFDRVASGHYAQITTLANRVVTRRGRDTQKDQSYFLWAVPSERLAKTIFPIGDLTKSTVRHEAVAVGLPVARKPDSQGICFIGQINFADWLQAELTPEPGEVVTFSGRVVGRHEGCILYTIGQRHGYEIDDKAAVAREYGLDKSRLPRLFVVGKDIAANRLIVADQVEALQATHLTLVDYVWHVPPGELPAGPLSLQARYRQTACLVREWREGAGGLAISLQEPVMAAAPGQFAVLYHKDRVAGGGVIHSVGGCS